MHNQNQCVNIAIQQGIHEYISFTITTPLTEIYMPKS